MEKKLSAKKILWLRIQDKLLMNEGYGDSYSCLSPCARNVLFLAALKCCENYREFNTNYYHIVLQALQFFLGGYASLNTMAKTNFSRQNYRTALHELEMGKWAVIERMVPIINPKTGQITKKNNLGVIIDMSCLVKSENKEEFDFKHPPTRVVMTGPTSLIVPDAARPLEEAANHPDNHPPTRGVTTGGDAGTPMDTEKINGQNLSGNHPPSQGGTTGVTSLIEPDVATPLEEAANHPGNHPLTTVVTIGGNAETTMNAEEINGQNISGNHRPNQGVATLVTDKYCCCRYDELKDSVVPTDKEGYPLCPLCGKFLELNRKKQFYGHPDWATGPCRKTFSAKSLIANWETKRKKEQQQQQHERSTKFAVEKYTKNLSQRAAASHCLTEIKALLPNDVDKIRQQLPTENGMRTNYEELKIRKRNRENY